MSSTLGASLLRTVLSDGTLKILGSGLDKGPIINIVQYHHSCEVSSSKIRQFFAEFHVSQFLRNYNVYKMCGFAVMTAKRVRGSVSEAVLLPTEAGTVYSQAMPLP